MTVIDEKILPPAHTLRALYRHYRSTLLLGNLDLSAVLSRVQIDRIPPPVPAARPEGGRKEVSTGISWAMIASGDRLADNFFPHAGQQLAGEEKKIRSPAWHTGCMFPVNFRLCRHSRIMHGYCV